MNAKGEIINTKGRKVAMQKPNSTYIYLVCTYDNTKNKKWRFVGDDCIVEMVKQLHKISKKIIKEMRANTKIEMNETDNEAFNNADTCYLCSDCFDEKNIKVRDHCHRTGSFRGAACQKCNINHFSNRYLPVVFHNLSGFDSHFIIREAHKIINELTDLVPCRYKEDDLDGLYKKVII